MLAEMARQEIDAANLSRKAGLNPRAVKDIEEGRSKSPKLSSVVAIANALGVSVYDMVERPPGEVILPELSEFLAGKSENEQRRILSAIQALQGGPDA